MASTKKTTIKPVSLGYRPVGSLDSVQYTTCMGLAKGFSITQDAPDEQAVDAEFYDSPFAYIYKGKPIVMNFDLVNYTLEEIKALFGGTYTAADATHDETLEGSTVATPSEFEWKVSFQHGNPDFIIYKGSTIGTIKKDADGAMAYTVKITSQVYNDGTKDLVYKILGDPKTA